MSQAGLSDSQGWNLMEMYGNVIFHSRKVSHFATTTPGGRFNMFQRVSRMWGFPKMWVPKNEWFIIEKPMKRDAFNIFQLPLTFHPVMTNPR